MPGYPGAYNASITNQFTAGGNKKAGIAPTVGKGHFAMHAILHGAAGHTATNTIPSPADYHISRVNQLGGIGRFRSMFVQSASADGVNLSKILMGTAKVRAGPRMWTA